TNITTRIIENTIEISFENSRNDRELVIYRSIKPIITYNDLLDASLIKTFQSSVNIFIDHPSPGIPYFYIVMDSLLTISGQYVMNPGENITIQSTLIQNFDSSNITESRETLRNQPLPYLDIKSSIDSGNSIINGHLELPVKYVLTYETNNIVNTLLKNIYIQNKPELLPAILDEDIENSVTGEEYQLKRIIESDFIDKNWESANKLLTNFLSVDHSDNITIKAHYYYAQVLFFQNKYKESFLEFNIIRNNLPKETKPWMDTLLIYLRNDN
ncbi:MAG: hypothetical protein DRI73_02755, partial [Bacteroidetes bacterium]